jgi:hypothetical protein
VGFLDDVVGGGGIARATFDGREGTFNIRGGSATLNDREFVVELGEAQGGFVRFNGPGQPPDKHVGPIFPKDQAPRRGTLPDTDPTKWAPGKFSAGRPEDPYRPVIELVLRERETDETVVLTLQSKTSMAAARDFLQKCRKLPDDTLPIVKLGAGVTKTKYGTFKVPNFSVTGTTGGEDFDDPMGL